MKYYVCTKHPVTGETIAILPTGKIQEDTAEFRVLTPQSNLEILWLKRPDIFGKEHTLDLLPF